jgi:hypothetical protein
LNRTKSAEIVFISLMSKRTIVIPPPAVLEIPRVDSIKALGVTVSRQFSMSQHVDAVLAGCAQTLFALRILRQHECQTAHCVLFFRPLSNPRCRMPPQRGGGTRVLLTVVVYKPSSAGPFRFDTATRRLLHSLVFVHKQMKNCLTKFFKMRDIYCALFSLQKEVNTTRYANAVTTYNCLPAPQPSITITF